MANFPALRADLAATVAGVADSGLHRTAWYVRVFSAISHSARARWARALRSRALSRRSRNRGGRARPPRCTQSEGEMGELTHIYERGRGPAGGGSGARAPART